MGLLFADIGSKKCLGVGLTLKCTPPPHEQGSALCWTLLRRDSLGTRNIFCVRLYAPLYLGNPNGLGLKGFIIYLQSGSGELSAKNLAIY